jgi:hypothetical protein
VVGLLSWFCIPVILLHCFASLVLGYAAPDFEAACEQYISKDGPSAFVCLICGKVNQTNTNAKNHLQAIHLSDQGLVYACSWCSKLCKTKHALDCHVSKVHRNPRKNLI